MPCQTPHLDETSSAAPHISPSTVEDDESLLRSVFNPDHIKDGQIQPSAISLKDLQERGFSVNRLKYVTQEFLENTIDQFLARTFQGSPRESEGVAYFQARAVREVQDNGTQVFVVINTALLDNRGQDGEVFEVGSASRDRFLEALSLCHRAGQIRLPADGMYDDAVSSFGQYRSELQERFSELAQQRTTDQRRQRAIVNALLRKALQWQRSRQD